MCVGESLKLAHNFVVLRRGGPQIFHLGFGLLGGLGFLAGDALYHFFLNQTGAFLLLLLEAVLSQFGPLLAEAVLGNVHLEKVSIFDFGDLSLGDFAVVFFLESGFDVLILLARGLAHGLHFSHLECFKN